MKNFLGTLGTIIFAFGIAIGLLGLVMIGYGVLAPAQPPPSLNEGHAYGFVFGILVTFIGLAGVAIGRAIESAVTRPPPARTAAKPAVTADERLRGPNDLC